jgi:N-acetyl-anhydromuramyl-L-alanine amidase AmpD
MTTDHYPMATAEGTIINERQALAMQTGRRIGSIDSIRYIIIHCSATRENTDYTVEHLQRDHLAAGFIKIGYHFYIRRDGTVTKHRELNEAGAHCRPFNHCSIGICYEGGLDAAGKPADTRTPEQTAQLILLITKLKALFPKADVRGHRDMPGATPKLCPCFDVGVLGF